MFGGFLFGGLFWRYVSPVTLRTGVFSGGPDAHLGYRTVTRSEPYWVVVRNPRIWIYLVVALVAAGFIGYTQWRDSDAQRLQRCIDASITQMKKDTPALAGFDNAQPALVAMSRASCVRQLGISPG